MTDQDEREFAIALQQLALLYGKEIPATRIAAYFTALQDFPLPAICAGLAATGRTEKHFPAVAVIRAAVAASGLAPLPKKGSYPPDVAAQRRRDGLDVDLPVKPDRDAKFGHRWGVQPKRGMTYDDIVREARARGGLEGPPMEKTPSDYHATHLALGIRAPHCRHCAAVRASEAP